MYAKNLSLLHAICLSETDAYHKSLSTKLEDYDPVRAASFLACYITSKAIIETGRDPVSERLENFDMLSVYQAYALIVYAYLVLPLAEDEVFANIEEDQIVIAKSLFSELETEEIVDIIDSGMRKFKLIGEAESENWVDFREEMNKSIIAFLVAGTDDSAPYQKEELIPVLGTYLSWLCESFS
jgi:hypothetical protein